MRKQRCRLIVLTFHALLLAACGNWCNVCKPLHATRHIIGANVPQPKISCKSVVFIARSYHSLWIASIRSIATLYRYPPAQMPHGANNLAWASVRRRCIGWFVDLMGFAVCVWPTRVKRHTNFVPIISQLSGFHANMVKFEGVRFLPSAFSWATSYAVRFLKR